MAVIHHSIIYPGPDFVFLDETEVMRRLEDLVRQLRPKQNERAILIYGSQYKLWLLGKYIGTATWMHDDYLGDSFQNKVTVNGELLQFVYVADTWELVIRSRRQEGTN